MLVFLEKYRVACLDKGSDFILAMGERIILVFFTFSFKYRTSNVVKSIV